MTRKHSVESMNLKIDNVDFLSENEYNKGGMRIYWSGSIGYGTLDIVKRAGNNGYGFLEDSHEEMVLEGYTERMDSNDDKEFIRKILSLIADFVNIVD